MALILVCCTPEGASPSGTAAGGAVASGGRDAGGGNTPDGGSGGHGGGKHTIDSSWALAWSSLGSDAVWGVAATPDGDLVIVGGASGEVTLGATTLPSSGGQDAFVARLGPDGTLRWAKVFGGEADETAYGVAVADNGSILLVGEFQGAVDFGTGVISSHGGRDGFVTALDADGSPRWTRSFGGTSTDRMLGLTVSGENSVAVFAACSGEGSLGDLSVPCPTGGSMVASLAIDAGAPEWVRVMGADARAIDAAPSGAVIVAGAFDAPFSLEATSLTPTSDTDVFVAAWDNAGTLLWARSFEGIDDQFVNGMAVSAVGEILLTGDFQGNVQFGSDTLTSAGADDVFGSDIFLAKLSASGDAVWSRSFGDINGQTGWEVAFGPKGNIALTGFFAGTLAIDDKTVTSAGKEDIFGADIYVAWLDATGHSLWLERYGDALDQAGWTVALNTQADSVFMGGQFEGAVEVHDDKLSAIGAYDGFIAKIPLGETTR